MNFFVGLFMMASAGVSLLIAFEAYPKPLAVLPALLSLWFTSRSVYYFDLPVQDILTEEQQEIKDAIDTAKQMVAGGGSKEDAEQWLKARMKILKARWDSNANNQSDGDN